MQTKNNKRQQKWRQKMPRKSTEQYPPDWQEIARQTKEDAGYRCVRCHHIHDIEAGYMLTVHHIDLNKSNCRWWNLAALCQRCHLQIQHKVIIERTYMFEHSKWFKPYVAGYYAFTNGLPDDKAFVQANLEQLLDFGRPIKLFQVLEIAS
jgi:5-methylcytosine-specific restriction endonuclease McrA